MVAFAFSGWWIAGWAVGFGGAVVGALLLIAIIALARRIAAQGRDITAAIDSARDNTAPLYDVREVNADLARIAEGLAAVREGRT